VLKIDPEVFLLLELNPILEDSMSILPQYITSGSLNNISSKKGVIIGAWLARYLGIEVGDTVNITTTNLRSSILGTFPRLFHWRLLVYLSLKLN